MHLWLVNPFDPLPSDHGSRHMRYQMLVAELLRRRHQVTWISADFMHTLKAYRRAPRPEQLPEGLQVALLPTSRYRWNIGPGRLIHHAQYCARLRRWMERSAPPDGIVVSYPLPEAARDCLRYGHQMGVPVVVDVQDRWPDAFLDILPPQLHWLGRGLLTPMYQQSREVFQQTTQCVTVSQHYLEWAQACRGPQAFDVGRVYYLGYDPTDRDGTDDEASMAELLARGFTPETTNFSFIGTLGVSYDIACLIKAARYIAAEQPQVRFMIAGDGPRRARWQAMATQLGLKNVIFLGFLKTGPLRTMLHHSFAGLITIRTNRQSVQNKPGEYMAFGLPLISSLEGEFAQLVDQEPLGVSYRAEDVDSLTGAIRRLLDAPTFAEACRQRVRQLFAERFSAEAIYPAYVDDLEQICMPTTAERELGR